MMAQFMKKTMIIFVLIINLLTNAFAGEMFFFDDFFDTNNEQVSISYSNSQATTSPDGISFFCNQLGHPSLRTPNFDAKADRQVIEIKMKNIYGGLVNIYLKEGNGETLIFSPGTNYEWCFVNLMFDFGENKIYAYEDGVLKKETPLVYGDKTKLCLSIKHALNNQGVAYGYICSYADELPRMQVIEKEAIKVILRSNNPIPADVSCVTVDGADIKKAVRCGMYDIVLYTEHPFEKNRKYVVNTNSFCDIYGRKYGEGLDFETCGKLSMTEYSTKKLNGEIKVDCTINNSSENQEMADLIICALKNGVVKKIIVEKTVFQVGENHVSKRITVPDECYEAVCYLWSSVDEMRIAE